MRQQKNMFRCVPCRENMSMLSVGAAPHPMEKEHYIEWITLATDQGIYKKKLAPGEDQAADFYLAGGEKVKEVYAYCNLHALWMSEV